MRAISSVFWVLCSLTLAIGPISAASPDQAPPVPPGMARVWFLQELVPGSSFYAPMLYVNGTKIAISPEGSAFYRDYTPGTYVFSIESCGPGPQPSQQLTVGANQQFALQVQNDDTALSDCLVYYFTQVPPQFISGTFAPLRYLGQN
jgi:hypothetical protein